MIKDDMHLEEIGWPRRRLLVWLEAEVNVKEDNHN